MVPDDAPQVLTPAMGKTIKAIWDDPKAQEAFGRRNEFELRDDAAYLFDRLDELSTEGRLPSDVDVLHAPMHRGDICFESFRVKSMGFKAIILPAYEGGGLAALHAQADRVHGKWEAHKPTGPGTEGDPPVWTWFPPEAHTLPSSPPHPMLNAH